MVYMVYDVINAIYAAAVVSILFNIYKVPLSYYFIVLGHLALVFLTNDFLFPINYMPDQFRYIHAASGIRDSFEFLNYTQFDHSSTVANAALFFAIFPILFLKTVFSISIINFMLYAFLFIFLYKKKVLVGNGIWFYLFYPSFSLYAAIGGRDTLILVIMVISIYQLYKGNSVLAVIFALPLLILKPQNFFIFFLSFIIYQSINKGNIFSINNLYKYILMVIGLLVFLQFFSIEEINMLRLSMFMEDGGKLSDYIPISDYLDFIVIGISGAFYMLLKPLIWESHNVLQLIQAFENIFIFIIIYKLIKNLNKINDNFKYFLFIYFFVAMAIYGIVVFNFGTAARYKYTFVVVFVLFSIKLIAQNKGKQDEKNSNYNAIFS